MKAKDNPFRVERLDRLGYLPVDDTWPDILRRLGDLHHRAAIVGPHGTGKTTLLDTLAEHLQNSGWTPHRVFINDTTPAPPMRDLLGDPGSQHVLLIDGAERLPRWTWARVKRRSRRLAGLIITTHRPGMLPTLVNTRATPALMHALIARLPEVRLDDLPVKPGKLLHECGGNIRQALRRLYDHYAARPVR